MTGICEDRTTLQLMAALAVPVQQYKVALGWAAEKVGRLKPSGHLLTRSPLSDLEEIEAMRLGVEGKAACWQMLRLLAITTTASTVRGSTGCCAAPTGRRRPSRGCGSGPRPTSWA